MEEIRTLLVVECRNHMFKFKGLTANEESMIMAFVDSYVDKILSLLNVNADDNTATLHALDLFMPLEDDGCQHESR